MRAYGQTMTDVVNRYIDNLPKHRPIRMLKLAQEITFEIIMETVFGAPPSEHPELNQTILDLLNESENMILLLSGQTNSDGSLATTNIDRALGKFSPTARFRGLKKRLQRSGDAA